MTALPKVIALKCFKSAGKCHGISLSAPIILFFGHSSNHRYLHFITIKPFLLLNRGSISISATKMYWLKGYSFNTQQIETVIICIIILTVLVCIQEVAIMQTNHSRLKHADWVYNNPEQALHVRRAMKCKAQCLCKAAVQ